MHLRNSKNINLFQPRSKLDTTITIQQYDATKTDEISKLILSIQNGCIEITI